MSTLGRCDDCGGSKQPYIVYRWSGKPLLREALCPVHRTPLMRTTRPKDYTRIRDVVTVPLDRAKRRTS